MKEEKQKKLLAAARKLLQAWPDPDNPEGAKIPDYILQDLRKAVDAFDENKKQ